MQQALQAGEFEELDGGRFRVAGHELEPDEVIVERGGLEGLAVASADGVTVALELGARRRAAARRPRLRPDPGQVNSLRQGRGPRADRPHRPHASRRAESELVERHGDWIKDEVLAVEIRLDGASEDRQGLTAGIGSGDGRLRRLRERDRSEIPLLPLVRGRAAAEGRGVLLAAREQRRAGRSASRATSATSLRCASACGTTASPALRSRSTRTRRFGSREFLEQIRTAGSDPAYAGSDPERARETLEPAGRACRPRSRATAAPSRGRARRSPRPARPRRDAPRAGARA